MTLLVIDYGVGNHQSVANALDFLRCRFVLSGRPADLERASAYILPGVGAFGEAMNNLNERSLAAPLREQVLARGKPILGICLGMQLLAESSEEAETHEGLGLIAGKFHKLKSCKGHPVPHVGWNDVRPANGDPLYSGVEAHSNFFFDHSYHFVGDRSLVTATCKYGEDLAASVRRGNVFGVQFHPEKSQRSGLRLLSNFCGYALSRSGNGNGAC